MGSLALLCVLVILLILLLGCLYEHYSLEKELDEIYSTTIYPEASAEIDDIVQKMSGVPEPEEKLTLLSRWIQKDFVISLNNPSFKRDDPLNYIEDRIISLGYLNGDHYYYSDSTGRRLIRTGKYYQNPFCIAYYRAGACGEHATLAQYVGNLSGLNTRIVGDPSGYHAWVEVNINDTWYFYDPTTPVDGGPVPSCFGPRSENTHNGVIADAARIVTEDEDITDQYPPTGTLQISGLSSIDNIALSWTRSGKTHRSMLSPQNETLTVQVRPKTYTVSVSRLFVFSDTQQVTVTEGNVSKIRVFA